MDIIDGIMSKKVANALRYKQENGLKYIKVYVQNIEGGLFLVVFATMYKDYDPPDQILYGTCYINREEYTYEYIYGQSILGLKKTKQLAEVN